MPIEIERKFLVNGIEWKKQVTHSRAYRQGYLSTAPARTVRIRIVDAQAWLTIKSSTDGLHRQEFEYEIPHTDGVELLAMCKSPVIEKVRHLIEFGGHCWEVDEFLAENAGLVVAELELESADQRFDKPPWAGEEVTQDARYYNSSLSQSPYRTWNTTNAKP